ncbi:MAG: pitrilysin family protein [Bacteroidota bacterium]
MLSQPAYNKTILPNGARVISERITSVRSVSIGIWIEAGSRDESEKNNGISHFIEHMVFKGTKRRSVREIARSLEAVGGYLNAFTGKEHTCFYARVLDEHAELALDVLSDLVQHPTFPERDLEKEKGVVIEELKNAEDDPDDIIHDYFDRAVFGSHALGRPVIGVEQNLRAFTRTDLMHYLRQHYHPSKMVIAAAGNIDHETLVRLSKRFLNAPGKRTGSGHSPRVRPKVNKPHREEFQKPIQQAHVCLGTQAYSVTSRYRYPLLVLNTLLGDGMSSRLFQNIREKYGFAYTVYSYVNMMSDAGVFGTYVGTDRSHVNFSIELIMRELEKLRKKPVPKAELARTKAQLKGSMMLSLESIPNRMMRLGSSELYFGELKPIDSIIQQVDRVSQENVLEVANDLLIESRLTSIIFQPDQQHERARADALAIAARRK